MTDARLARFRASLEASARVKRETLGVAGASIAVPSDSAVRIQERDVAAVDAFCEPLGAERSPETAEA